MSRDIVRALWNRQDEVSDNAADLIIQLQKKLGIAIQALSLIASEQKDREACKKMARETLEMLR